MSAGFAAFLFTLAAAFEWGDFVGWSEVPLIFASLGVVSFGLLVWWRQDWSYGVDGKESKHLWEPKSSGTPFQNIDIRKVALWMFLMSEMSSIWIGLGLEHKEDLRVGNYTQSTLTRPQYHRVLVIIKGTA